VFASFAAAATRAASSASTPSRAKVAMMHARAAHTPRDARLQQGREGVRRAVLASVPVQSSLSVYPGDIYSREILARGATGAPHRA
jgi:hypothetical protein